MSIFDNRISLHTWTLDTTPLPDALRVAKDAGYAGVETRYVDFKRCFDAGMSNEQVMDILLSSGIQVTVMGTEYGVIFAKGEEQRRMFRSLDMICADAKALGCEVVMVAPSHNPPGTIREAAASFREGGEIAAKHGVRFALEFNSRHPVINKIEVAQEILALADHPACGLLLDAYHMHCSGATGRAFECVPAKDILAFQFSDAPATPTPERRPVDRLPPGKGAVRWNEVFQCLREKNYTGYLNYEAPNPAQWKRPPREVADEGLAETRRLLKTAFQ